MKVTIPLGLVIVILGVAVLLSGEDIGIALIPAGIILIDRKFEFDIDLCKRG